MQKEIIKALPSNPKKTLQQLRVRTQVCSQRYAQESQRFMVKYSIQESSPLGDVDAALATELNALFAAGEQRHKLDTLYYSVRHRLNLRDVDFREAAAAKAGVRLATDVSARDPVPSKEVFCLVADLLKATPTPAQIWTAAWALLTFDLYCRPSDLTAVRVQDVHMLKRKAPMITFFPANRDLISKTNTQDDTIPISNRPGMAEILRALVAGKSPTCRILPMSLSQIKKELAPLLLQNFTPHMLRHGGASLDGVNGATVEAIAARGRWATMSAVSRYRKPGRYLRALAAMDPKRKKRGEELKSSLGFKVAELLLKLN